MRSIFFHSGKHKSFPSIGLLILRVAFGAAMLTHGTPKLTHYAERASTFPDPLEIGSPWSLGLVIFAEFFCSIFIILGLGTRFAALAISICMTVAGFWVLSGHPFKDREMALLYLTAFLAILILGAGKYSLDKMISKK